MTKTLLLVLGLATAAGAAVLDGKTQSTGSFSAAQAATGASTNSVKLGNSSRFRAMVVSARNTAGTATVDLQINCPGGAADWANVSGGSMALTVSAGAISVVYPACEYRVNVSACSTCSVTASYVILPELQ